MAIASPPAKYWQIFYWSVFCLPFSQLLGSGGLLILSLLLARAYGSQRLQTGVGKASLLIALLLVSNSWTAFDRLEALVQLVHFLPLLLLFNVLPLILTTTNRLRYLAMNLVVTSVPVSLWGLIEFIGGEERPDAVFDNPNVLASYLVVILGLQLGLLLETAIQGARPLPIGFKGQTWCWQRWQACLVLGLSLGLTLVTLVVSGSRNGLITAGVEIVLLVLIVSLAICRSPRVLLLSLALLGGTTAIALQWFGQHIRRLPLELFTHDPRLRIWSVAIALIQERPWTGWGLGSFKLLYPLRATGPDFSHPHNFWLLLAAEAGLPLLLAFVLLVGSICYRGSRILISQPKGVQHHVLLLGYLLAFSGCTLAALFDCTFYDVRVNVINWIILVGIYRYAEMETAAVTN